MTWSFVGIVTDVRGEDNPPSCLVRNQQTGRDAWYHVAAQVAPPLRVGEWVRVSGGGDPDEPRATDPAPQVVDRAAPPAPPTPLPVAAAVQPPEDPSRRERAGILQVQPMGAGIRVSLSDPSGDTWSVVRLDTVGWTAGEGEAPRVLTAEAYAALEAVVAVYRLAIMHL